MSESGHFQTKSEAASLPVYWSHPPAGADVHVRPGQRARVARLFSGSSPARWQTLPTEALGKGLRVFRLSEAETIGAETVPWLVGVNAAWRVPMKNPRAGDTARG
jgi:hypothetical protein